MNIEIRVEKKIATVIGSPLIVCGNDDYVITFTFDEEWDKYNAKTARFTYTRDGKSKNIDIPFMGNICPVPVLSNINRVEIGVYAGDVRSTTVAVIMCEKSILCAGGAPEEPNDDVYGQIMELFNTKVLNPDVVTAIDNTYNPESENPQSGKAVAQALQSGCGLSTTEKQLIIDILSEGIYETDVSEKISQLAIEFGIEQSETEEPDTPVDPEEPDKPASYSITNTLTNTSNSNSTTSINEGESYVATITANEGYNLESVSCTMGGVAQTVSDGVINIASVTGDIVIVATATEEPLVSKYTQLNYLETGIETDVTIPTGATVGATDRVEIVFGVSYAGAWNNFVGEFSKLHFRTRLNALYLNDQVIGTNETIYTFDNLTGNNAGTEWVDNLKCIIDSTALSLYDGNNTLLNTVSYTSKTAFTMWLFSESGSGKSYYTRIRDVKVYSSDNVLKYHFIPVADTDGTLCMYDTVNRTYHYNSKTGTFISGGAINV